MPRNANTFRVTGKSIFLTYPQCPLIPIFVIDYLYQLLKNFNPTYARVCTENHASGEPHLHCLVQTDKKFDIKNPRFFDIKDPRGRDEVNFGSFHPNCQVPRRDADVADYIAKGGQFEERGILKAGRRSPKKSRDTIWAAILNESTSKSEFLARVQRDQPFIWATQLRNLEYAANSKWADPVPVYEPRFRDFPNVPEPIREWAEQNLYCVSAAAINTVSHIHIPPVLLTAAHDLTTEFIYDEVYANPPIIVNDPGPETGSPIDADN
uniref:Replication-associated protein n=1 Tax=Capulavirus medicagonis TaxID=1306546 RepID=A0A3S7GUE7_9GEMI|nr:RepA [Alfalfa leaf curl virus]